MRAVLVASSNGVGSSTIIDGAISQWRQVMPLHLRLPIVFSDGTQLARFAVDCGQCRRSLNGDLVRGVITPQPGDRFELAGLAACQACASFTRFTIMCTGSSGSVQLEWSAAGELKRREVHPTWWTKLKTIFR